jgi:hypothetical protein
MTCTPRLLPAVSVACLAAAALASCSGRLAVGGASDAGAEAGGCGGGPPASAVRAVSLAVAQVNFGDDPDATAWQAIGFDLDGKCTTATSSDVCQLAAGSPRATQVDGTGGIDNSFGANICMILDTTLGTGACSTKISQAYLVTDATGTGTLAIRLAPFWIEIPISGAYVALDGGSGMLGAVTTPSSFWVATENGTAAFVEGGPSVSCPCGGCSGGFDSILPQIEQASDILDDGSNTPYRPCDAISIGMQFSGATSFTGALPDVPDACGT